MIMETDIKNSNKANGSERINLNPDRQSRALPRFENSEVVDLSEEEAFQESVLKSPSEKSSLYVIPHLRPGRTPSQITKSEDPNESYSDLSLKNILDFQDHKGEEVSEDDITQQDKKDMMIPIPRYGRSKTLMPMVKFRRSDSMIPMMRFGRSTLIPMARYGRSNSLIPMARYGRSDSLIPMARYGRSETLIPMARYGKSDSLISMARYGRSDSLIPMARYGRSDSLIPMARYGRSNTLIPMARYGRSASLIPMARYGRSDSLIPMARYGRSDSLIPMARYGRSESLIPMIRYGRSGSLIPLPRFGKSVEFLEISNIDSDEMKSGENSEEESDLEFFKLPKRSNDDNGAIIPYPRPGREVGKDNEKNIDELNSSDSEIRRQTNESLIPQIRYGRSSGTSKLPEKEQSHIFILPNMRPGRSSKNVIIGKEKENLKSVQYELLPYPRPGRSDLKQNDMNKHYGDNNENTDYIFPTKRSEDGMEEVLVLDTTLEYDILETDYEKSEKEQNLNSDQDSSRFVIPYPRPGKRDLTIKKVSTSVLPKNYPHLFKFIKGNFVHGSSNINDQKDNDAESRRSSSILPFPTTRTSNYIPFSLKLRKERSDTVVPFPRPGRSDTIVPFPRPGRSDTIVPFPRPGRSDTIVPFPRPGRSDTIVPFPRPGRSGLNRISSGLGRSEAILPYPRPERSTAIVPIPRPGRSANREVLNQNIQEYSSPNSETENNSINELNSEFFGTLFQKNFERDSNQLKDIPNITKKLNKEILTSNSVYLLPYPRPGRVAKRNTT